MGSEKPVSHEESYWPLYTCVHCRKDHNFYVGYPAVWVQRRDAWNNLSCWVVITCPHCLGTKPISMLPSAMLVAVSQLGATQVILAPSDPAPEAKAYRRQDDAVSVDEMLDFGLAMVKKTDEELLEELHGGEPV